MKLNESLGLTKTASEDVYEAMVKGASILDMFETDIVNVIAELDPETGVVKEASDMGIDPYLYMVSLGERISGNDDLVKISAEKGADPYEVSAKIIEKGFVPGEISKIAAQVLYLYGNSDTEKSLEKSASEIGVSADMIKVATIALELSAEGLSPEILKEAAEASGYDYKSYASHLIEGEKWAMDKMASSRLSEKELEKLAESEKISDPFMIGALNTFVKLSGIDRPNGVYSVVSEELEKLSNADLIADYYVKTGAIALGMDPDGVETLYAYYDPEYAFEKHAARVPEEYDVLSKIALNTLGRIGAAVESGVEFPEDPIEAVEKTAAMLKESTEDVATRLFITGRMLSGDNPANIVKEASEYIENDSENIMDGIAKLASAEVEDIVGELEHEKIASVGYDDLMEDVDDLMEKEASQEDDYEYVSEEEYILLKQATDLVVSARVDFNKAIELDNQFAEKTAGIDEDTDGGLNKIASIAEAMMPQMDGLDPYSPIGLGVRAINNMLK